LLQQPLAAAGSPAAIDVKLIQIRTAEIVIVKVRVAVEPFAIRGTSDSEVARIHMVRTQVEGVDSISAKMSAFEAAAHVAAHIADVYAAGDVTGASARACASVPSKLPASAESSIHQRWESVPHFH
jgi:hypothetical protein